MTAAAPLWKDVERSAWFLIVGLSDSQVRIAMDKLSIQERTEMRTGIWTSLEPPDPAFPTWDSRP